MSAITKAQIGAIHSLKSRAGLDDLSYRDMLEQQTGERSAARLSSATAGRVIEHLKAIAGGKATSQRPTMGGPWGKKAQALWISGWCLGVFRQREDAALLEFVRKQTKVDHINWVKDPKHGSAVVDALKAILRREAGVDWKADRNPAVCVLLAQLRIIHSEQPDLVFEFDRTSPASVNSAMQTLGERIRAMKAGV